MPHIRLPVYVLSRGVSENALIKKSAKIKAGVKGGFTSAYFGAVMSFMGADQRHAGGFFSPWGESDWETGDCAAT